MIREYSMVYMWGDYLTGKYGPVVAGFVMSFVFGVGWPMHSSN